MLSENVVFFMDSARHQNDFMIILKPLYISQNTNYHHKENSCLFLTIILCMFSEKKHHSVIPSELSIFPSDIKLIEKQTNIKTVSKSFIFSSVNIRTIKISDSKKDKFYSGT